MKEHLINPRLLTQQVRVAVIGAGGTGSQVLNGLSKLHMAMLSLGHPKGLQVTVWDDDVVSESNIGRQSFFPCDVGRHKAPTLVNRINLGFGLRWESSVERVTQQSHLQAEIVISCVDNRRARKAILTAAQESRTQYWLDCGNRLSDGQVILGEVTERYGYGEDTKPPRLPHAADLFPELVDGELDAINDIPSCSLADALEKQSLFINTAVAMHAGNLLFELFRHGRITHHGVFVNLKSGRSSPLPVSEEAWKRFGYVLPDAKASKPAKKGRGKKEAAAA